MRPAVPDLHLGLPLLVMWLVVVLVVVAVYLILRRWRRRHPKVVPREASYSERLQHRLAESQERVRSADRSSKRSGDHGKRRGSR